MAGISNYESALLINSIFRAQAYTPAATLWIALCTSAPAAGSTGSTIVETTYTGYARVAVVSATSAWNTPAAGVSANTAAIEFPASSGPSSTVTHFAICDAVTAGNLVAYGALTSSKTVASGDTPQFAAGDLDLQLV